MKNLIHKMVCIGTITMLVPLTVYADVPPSVIPRCGQMNGLWLSALLTVGGLWLVHWQMRPRK